MHKLFSDKRRTALSWVDNHRRLLKETPLWSRGNRIKQKSATSVLLQWIYNHRCCEKLKDLVRSGTRGNRSAAGARLKTRIIRSSWRGTLWHREPFTKNTAIGLDCFRARHRLGGLAEVRLRRSLRHPWRRPLGSCRRGRPKTHRRGTYGAEIPQWTIHQRILHRSAFNCIRNNCLRIISASCSRATSRTGLGPGGLL